MSSTNTSLIGLYSLSDNFCISPRILSEMRRCIEFVRLCFGIYYCHVVHIFYSKKYWIGFLKNVAIIAKSSAPGAVAPHSQFNIV